MSASRHIPIIDIQSPSAPSLIHSACRSFGFFYIVNHQVPESLIDSLMTQSHTFFSLPKDEKEKIHMKKGGKAWRGYFSVGEELTSGQQDIKEGIYFGEEQETQEKNDKSNRYSSLPLHGANLFPSSLPSFPSLYFAYFHHLRQLSSSVLSLIALSLGLEQDYFKEKYEKRPTCLFRIFHYPAVKRENGPKEEEWGVGVHTDYGMLTILKQDDVGGLQIKLPSGEWIEAPPVPSSFIVNIGDMMQLITNGYYLSTPHRVKAMRQTNRISMPFFYDPGWFDEVKPIDLKLLREKATEETSENAHSFDIQEDTQKRWDHTSPLLFRDKYGEYLVNKVGKVFPSLMSEVKADLV